jgi:hypothetical protein
LRQLSGGTQTHGVSSRVFPGRHFQLWNYQVSHAMLLLRSPKDADHSTRVEIAFKNVRAIKLPTRLDDLAISVADESSAQSIRAEAGALKEGGEVFLIEGVGTKGYVIAGIAFGQEDEGDYAEPSPLLSGRWNGPGWQLPGQTQRST